MNASGYALIGLTAIVAVLASMLTFAVLRFMTAARAMTRPERRISTENALLSAALEESVARLKAQERATAARADASERLSSEIISSLTAGLHGRRTERGGPHHQSGGTPAPQRASRMPRPTTTAG